ncbi:MAG: hypothetical protein QF768_19530 [Candidatus Latescibacteria bacterium]|nr:hypothetical protein [Candidatus Latescibacterota bacterium]MDP7633782.1 hypothetical protein [Candidatus Latescibacterota bacterium]
MRRRAHGCRHLPESGFNSLPIPQQCLDTGASQSRRPDFVGVRLGQTAYTFPSRSRIVVTLTRSDFPRILPHPHHMGPLFEGEVLIAQTQILHGSSFSSRLELPVIDDV